MSSISTTTPKRSSTRNILKPSIKETGEIKTTSARKAPTTSTEERKRILCHSLQGNSTGVTGRISTTNSLITHRH